MKTRVETTNSRLPTVHSFKFKQTIKIAVKKRIAIIIFCITVGSPSLAVYRVRTVLTLIFRISANLTVSTHLPFFVILTLKTLF
jgi:hypothetical protein